MSSLFRSMNSGFSTKRENAIKEALINTLQENVREIQYEVQQSGNAYLELCEATSSLCTTLEAFFLHGLKDSFLWQTINVIAGDVDRRPEPSFWSPLMVFMHKQVIEQIQSLSQITSEIGQCRAWVRLSVNESLFSSYLNNIRKNSTALRPYYKNYALLKDSDGLESAARVLAGLETQIQLNLPVNSSLLNQWPNYALQLSGVWTPPLKSCPISSGVDVAGSIPAETLAIPTPQPLRTNELFAESISNSPFSQCTNFGVEDLSHRENLELFLQKVDEMAIITEEDDAAAGQEKPDESNNALNEENVGKLKKKRKHAKISQESAAGDHKEDGTTVRHAAQSLHGNSLSNLMQNSWSSDASAEVEGMLRTHTFKSGNATLPYDERIGRNFERTSSYDDRHVRNLENSGSATPCYDDEHGRHLERSDSNASSNDDRHGSHFHRSVSVTSSVSSLRSPLGDRCSYNTLLKKHERTREVDWTEIWDKFLLRNATSVSGQSGGENDDEQNALERSSNGSHTNSDFEVVPFSVLEKFDIFELQEMVEQMCKLAREPGLDAQGFLCKSCQHPLGIGYTHFQVCAFSGNYYCVNCMDVEQVLIPSKIIYNWDFRKYSVSKRAATFLAEFRTQPFIDLKLLNPGIYYASEAMAELQSLRIRLNFIRAYLYTCCPSSIEELHRLFLGTEYLYEHIHQYSIGDLAMIQRGTLYQQLQKAYKIGEAHILKCALCSVKGFICEICNSPRVLYPFHIDTTYRCESCGAVFHANCLNEQQPCPKCERKKRREDLPLHEAVQSLI